MGVFVLTGRDAQQKELGEMPPKENTTEIVNTDGADGGKPEATPTQPTAAEVLAELEATRAALHKANSEAASRRKELEKYQQADEARKLAEMTELEKAQARIAEMETRLAQAESERETALIHSAIEREAVTLNFHDPADAWRFLDKDAVTLADGKVTGAKTALEALAKVRPYLVKQANIPDIDGDKGSTAKLRQDTRAGVYRKYGIRAPS